MDKCEFNRVLDQVKPTSEQEQAMLDRLLTEQKEVRPMNCMKKTIAVMAAAALLVMACAFTVATGLDQRILDYFGGTEEDARLLAPGFMAVDLTSTAENGAEVHISQVYSDHRSVVLVGEMTAPEGTALEQADYSFADFTLIPRGADGKEAGGGYGSYGVYGGDAVWTDEDPEDNHLTFLCFNGPEHASEARAMMGQEVTLCPLWLQESGGSKLRVDFSEEEQSCTVQLPEKESGRTYEVNAPIQVGEEEMNLGELYLSPIGVAFSLQGEENDSRMWGPTEMSYMEEGAVLHMADGEAVAVRRVVSQTYDQNTGAAYCVFQTEEIVKPENVVSVTLLGQTFSLDGLTPVEG